MDDRAAELIRRNRTLVRLAKVARARTAALSHPDQRTCKPEEWERPDRRRLTEAAAKLHSLAREACLQAQETRWLSVKTRAASASLRVWGCSNRARREVI